jgi:hypothetical protein
MQGEAARPVLGMNDVKAGLAEIFDYHVGKTGIIFDQEDTFAHDCPSKRCPSTTMPARPPRPAECHPVRDFPALFGAEHIGGIGQRLRDAFARRFGKPDLLGA